MTYASTGDETRTTITISRTNKSEPDTFVVDRDEHQITVEPTGVLRLDMVGQTILYAPGVWTRVYAIAGDVFAA